MRCGVAVSSFRIPEEYLSAVPTQCARPSRRKRTQSFLEYRYSSSRRTYRHETALSQLLRSLDPVRGTLTPTQSKRNTRRARGRQLEGHVDFDGLTPDVRCHRINLLRSGMAVPLIRAGVVFRSAIIGGPCGCHPP